MFKITVKLHNLKKKEYPRCINNFYMNYQGLTKEKSWGIFMSLNVKINKYKKNIKHINFLRKSYFMRFRFGHRTRSMRLSWYFILFIPYQSRPSREKKSRNWIGSIEITVKF